MVTECSARRRTQQPGRSRSPFPSCYSIRCPNAIPYRQSIRPSEKLCFGRGLFQHGRVCRLRLFRPRTCWLPTWQGSLLIFSTVTLLIVLAAQSLMPFLAPTRLVHGTFLVVDGWVPDYALEEAVRIFRNGEYRKLVVTGTEIELGKHISVEKTYAQLA